MKPSDCHHCRMPISLRNPSGSCDHLYYPESCETCNGEPPIKSVLTLLHDMEWRNEELHDRLQKLEERMDYWEGLRRDRKESKIIEENL